MSGALLVLNAGSSSIKFTLYAPQPGAALERVLRGAIDGVGTAPRFYADGPQGERLVEHAWAAQRSWTHEELLGKLLSWIEGHGGRGSLAGAAHRVVFGGAQHVAPVRVDAALLAQLETLVPFMPLHLPHNLAPIRALAAAHPGLPQVACFDTAFHAGLPPLARTFALPRALTERGVRRYGFHGLSYEYVAARLARVDPPAARGRTIIAHLGNGASLCALRDGLSVETTMGFSALDGLMMGTRPGALDPGVLLYLLRAEGYDAARLEQLLYHECGLLGVSGVSSDLRTLLQSAAPGAREAVELFCYRIVTAVGSLTAALGGLDALVFTGGIGENAVPVRQKVCAALAWLGLALDAAANEQGGPKISAPHSAISAWVIPTDEDRMIGEHARRLLEGAAN